MSSDTSAYKVFKQEEEEMDWQNESTPSPTNNGIKQEEVESVPPVELTWFSTSSLTNTVNYRGSICLPPRDGSDSASRSTPAEAERPSADERLRRSRKGSKKCPHCDVITLDVEKHILRTCRACPHEGCVLTFTSQKRRQKHIAGGKHRGADSALLEPKPFACDLCPRRYTRANDLANHKRRSIQTEKCLVAASRKRTSQCSQ
ncbi:hypothetical protein DL98DRAFT_586135 [Cadophora sp. DSE1049]|nr:hypothetical protein DL98DRAFT_586135 [Cadophora sp. DSE1049]